MTDKKKKEKLQKAKNAAIKNEIPRKHLSWIPFVIALAFMFPTSLLLYPDMWVKMFFAIEIHSETILTATGLVMAGAMFIKFDNWLRKIGRETSRKTRNANQMSKKMASAASPPDIYDIKLDTPKIKFQTRERDFSSNKKLGNYRHEKMLETKDMGKLGNIMNADSDLYGGHNPTSTRHSGSKGSGRR